MRYFIFVIKATIAIALSIFLIYAFRYFSKAAPVKANIKVNTRKIVGKVPQNWKALAQGGEEQGVRMLENVVPEITELKPRYIRLDHIYDFYNVVSRDSSGKLLIKWDELDKTVCDIYDSGAKPFFSLGYMPPTMSFDGSLVSLPKSWSEWTFLVKETIERYSGESTFLCDGKVKGNDLSDIYYEVWNEPDLETFGKWSLYPGAKSYRTLYFYSSAGAEAARGVHPFYLGGPATTALYKNWIQVFLDFVIDNRLRLNFISWHHYGKEADNYTQDMRKLKDWLAPERYKKFRNTQKIITEWGYDSNPNPISETDIGAAHTIAAISNLINENLKWAFAFEIKDGPQPRWGILSHKGEKKTRYHALKLLNNLDSLQLHVEGEGTYVKGISTYHPARISLLLVNYDPENRNSELVPVTFNNLRPGKYDLTTQSLTNAPLTIRDIEVKEGLGSLQHNIVMQANSVFLITLIRKIN